jgi:4-azaleucine resistance transporter AzlC
MKTYTTTSDYSAIAVAGEAFRYSIPVLLGYLAIGIAFGLMLVNAGYPWLLALFMSIIMYAGSGQYLAVSLLATGASIPTIMLMEFILNARHMAYGITMLKPYNEAGRFKWYLIFAMTDETFALLSSLPPVERGGRHPGESREERNLFMLLVSAFDHSYWTLGTVVGALAGTLIPFDFHGVDFALTALFIVLLVDQMFRVKKAAPFVISALVTVAAAAILPANITLITALALSLLLVHFLVSHGRPAEGAAA